jgi:hypothetical protein
VKTTYQCDLCGEKSENKASIERCEAQGHPDLSVCPPIGLIVRGEEGSFCGPEFVWVVQWVGVSSRCGHEYAVGFGNFRGNGLGDTFNFKDAKGGYDEFKMGRSTTSSRSVFSAPSFNKYYPEQGFRRWQDWPDTPAEDVPAFWRAVKALREAGIQPLVLRKGEAVPFTDTVLKDPYEDFPLNTYVRLKAGVKRGHCDKCGGSGVMVEMDDDRTRFPCDCRTSKAKVVGYLVGKQGGLKLDRQLAGFAYWNVDDVEVSP